MISFLLDVLCAFLYINIFYCFFLLIEAPYENGRLIIGKLSEAGNARAMPFNQNFQWLGYRWTTCASAANVSVYVGYLMHRVHVPIIPVCEAQITVFRGKLYIHFPFVRSQSTNKKLCVTFLYNHFIWHFNMSNFSIHFLLLSDLII